MAEAAESSTDEPPHIARGTRNLVDKPGQLRRFSRRATTNRDDDVTSVTMRPAIVVLAIVGHLKDYSPVLDWLRRRGMVVEIASTGIAGIDIHRDKSADLVLLGLPLPDTTGTHVIRALRQHDPRATIVVVGKDADVSSQLAAVELGAQEYVTDPVDGRRDLLFALGISLGVRRSDGHFRVLRAREAAAVEWHKVVAACRPMVDVMKQLRELCDWSLSGATPTVLLVGDRGTGKHHLAKALHYNGARRNRAFVAINCAALAPDALRMQLFGDVQGASRQGLFEVADGGTIFLDGIDSVPLGIQRDLLTAIEGRQVCRVGSQEPIPVDVQVVAGTRTDLAVIVRRNEFRPDLYYRLAVRKIALPPLRERGADIVGIAETMLGELASVYGVSVPELHREAAVALLRHSWPGNLHELRNELEHALLMLDDDLVRPEHLRFRHGSGSVVAEATGAHLAVSLAGDACPLERLEREVIRQALERHDGNVSRTARFLAVTRQTLLYRIKKYGLRAAPSTDPDDL